MTRTFKSSAELFVAETPVIPTVLTLFVDFVVKRYFYFLIGQGQPLPMVVFISMAVVLAAGERGYG